MRGFLLGAVLLFGSLPHTNTYTLQNYGFGSGGVSGATDSSNTYLLNGIAGEQSGGTPGAGSYAINTGLIQVQQANVPTISLDNESSLDYNKLHFVLTPDTHDASDYVYLIEVTTDSSFATGIQYLRSDGTLNSSFTRANNLQTATAWNASPYIVGLVPGTTYYAKAAAIQNKNNESPLSPVASAATAQPSITFSLVTSTQSTPPFSVDFGTLSPGSGTVYTSGQSITTGLTTNAASGGNIYIGGKNGGLLSSSTGYKINAVSSDLSSINEGFGVQSNSTTQTSGGPFTVVSPYNGSSNIVGQVSPNLGSLYTTTTPVSGGSGTLVLKAKAGNNDVAASDYQEVLTFVAAGNF